jgi:photosystem II stability/assembly factor-like uncharacterized protein
MNRWWTLGLGCLLSVSLCSGAIRAQEDGVEEGLRADERPDLSAVSLESSIPYPVPGETVEIRFRVRNNAQAPVGKVEVRLLADGKPIGTQLLDLNAGETGTARFPWTPAAAKSYALTATIDPAAQLPEIDRLDDTASAEVVVASRPAAEADLVVTGIELASRADGVPLVRITVQNQGTLAAAAPLEVRSGDQVVARIAVPAVAPGATSAIEVPLPNGASADQLSAELNPRFRTAQKHPEAALFQKDLRVARDLRVESLSVAATPPEKGRTRRATISFRVVNHGREAVTTPFRTSVFPGAVSADGKTLEPFIVTSAGLAAGQSLYISRTIALPDEIHQFEARVETDLDQTPGAGRVAIVPFENPVANVGRWVSIGPRQTTAEGLGAVGVLFSIAIDPSSSSTVYVGSHGSGVWKTTDGGASWSPITDSFPTLQIAALAVDPAQTSRVYVATPDAGIFRSEDGGTSWSQIAGASALNLTNCCDTLLVDPNHAGGLYLTSFNGIYHSTDSGASWTQSLSAGQAISLVLDRAGSGTLYASLQGNALNGKGIYRAALGGDAWSRLSGCSGGDLPAIAASASRITLALSGSTLFAGFRTPTSFQVARAATAGTCQTGAGPGLHWQSLWSADPADAPFLWNAVYADPVDSNFVYATGTDFWVSTDGGVSFSKRSGPHADHHGFAPVPASPGTFDVVCDGGIYQSTDHGANNSWHFLGAGISNVEFYDITNAATDPNLVIGGTQDNGTQKFNGASTDWAEIDGGDGGTVAIDPTNSQVLYAMNQNAPSVMRSSNGGGNWTGIANGLPTGGVCFNLQFYPHPTTPSTLIASCLGSLWRTTQPGNPWSAILTVDPDTVLRSTVDPSIDLYYAGTQLGKIFAGPGGGGWQQVFAHPASRQITDLEVDPDDKPTLYAAFAGTGAGRVYRLRRGSPVPQTMSATDITADLPASLTVRTFAVDRSAPWTVYAGTNAGVFRGQSSDGVSWHWTSYNNGLPPAVIINKLEVHPTSGVLRAGTFGRSAYEVNTDSPLGSLVSIEGRITLLRLEDVGTGYGPPSDSLDVEAVLWLDTAPGRAFGFQLRKDSSEAERTKMFDLLRDAFEDGRTIRIDYTRTGLRNGTVLRVADLP